MIRFVARTYPPCWVLKARIQKHQGKPLLFHDKCPRFFYVHYTTHGTYSFTSHPKDEAIMVKCLAQGHKRRDLPGRDSNPHSGNTRTWVQCTRPLGHNTPSRHSNSCIVEFLLNFQQINIEILTRKTFIKASYCSWTFVASSYRSQNQSTVEPNVHHRGIVDWFWLKFVSKNTRNQMRILARKPSFKIAPSENKHTTILCGKM